MSDCFTFFPFPEGGPKISQVVKRMEVSALSSENHISSEPESCLRPSGRLFVISSNFSYSG